ncbi:hypothetical protein F5146DRAFT_995285 [Armillaria mellea]|nr:hypothetical protein F5146DRAFT_995285 [Armillaria mellea]
MDVDAELLSTPAFLGFTSHGAPDADVFSYLRVKIDQLPAESGSVKSLLEKCRCFALVHAKKHFSSRSLLSTAPVLSQTSPSTFNKQAHYLMTVLSLLDSLVASAQDRFGQSINVVDCPFEVPARGSKLEPFLHKLDKWPALVDDAIKLQSSGSQLRSERLEIPEKSHTNLTPGTDLGLLAQNDGAAEGERVLCDSLLDMCRVEHLTGLMRKFLSLAIEIRMMANGGRSEYITMVERLYRGHPQYERLLQEIQTLRVKQGLLYATTHLSPLILFDHSDYYPTHLHMAQYGYKRASMYVRPRTLRLVEQHVWQEVLLLAAGSTRINQLYLYLRDIFDSVGGRQRCEMEESTFFPLPIVLSPPRTLSGGGTSGVNAPPIHSDTARAPADVSPDNQMQVDDPPVYADEDTNVDGSTQPEITGTDLHEPNSAAAARPSPSVPQAPVPRLTRSQAGHLPPPPAVYESSTQLPSRKRSRVQEKDADSSVTQPTMPVEPAQPKIDPRKASESLRRLLPDHLRTVIVTPKSLKTAKGKRPKVQKNVHNERDEHTTAFTAWNDAEGRFHTYEFRLLKCGSVTEKGHLTAIKNVDINRKRIEEDADPIHITNPDAALARHMDYASYISLTGAAVQAILEKQSILVYGLPDDGTNVDFDERGLEVLGSLGEVRSIQSFSRRQLESHQYCHLPNSSNPSLTLMLQHARAGESGQVLNALEFPLGGTVLKALPNHQGVASERSSFDRTKNLMARVAAEQNMGDPSPYPAHALSWGLCGLATSSTHQHRDSHGLPTHVAPLCGSKLWVLLKHTDEDKEDCNFYRDYLRLRFDEDEGIEDFFESEVLYLDNSTHLVMKPNILHYVLTLEHSVAYGGHFIPRTGIKAVIIGYVHTAFLTYSITNTLHPEIKRLLFRMLLNWCFHGTKFKQNSTDPHIPNWTEPKALLDIISLGNLVLYARALEGIGDLESDQTVLLEWITARDAYVFGVAAFQRDFTTDGVSNIFLESAKRFGASLYDYITAVEDGWELHPDSIGTDRDLFEQALGDAFDFKTAKEVLGWDVEKDFFRDAGLVDTDPSKRTLIWEPGFLVRERDK